MNNFTAKEVKDLNKEQSADTRKALGIVAKGGLIVAIIFGIYASCMLGYTEMVITHPLLASIVLVTFTITSIALIKLSHNN